MHGALHARRRRSAIVTHLVVALGIVAVCGACGGGSGLDLRVESNRLVDAHGDRVRLLGVNLSGPEYACAQGLGTFAGPTDARAIAAMTSWRINLVRVPLNEQCWLGINGMPARYSGAPYRAAIKAYVARLHKAGLYVILDLHWNAPGNTAARGQQPMADLDHAPAFWRSVAQAFKRDAAVLFDLYNEPGTIGWQCWRDGCQLPQGWRAAGMQALLDAVRSAGARQPVIATGPGSGTEVALWLRYRPRDPANQLVAGLHAYDSLECATNRCWDAQYRPVARTVPLIAGEFGETDCAHGFVDRFMDWADSAGVSYAGWAWNPFGCAAPALIISWDGQPTAYGEGLRNHLRRVSPRK